MVKVNGESAVNGVKCTMERISPQPRTVTIPPSKTCTTGTTSKSLGISVVEDDAQAQVLHKRTVDEKVIRSVAEGASSIRAVAGQVGETLAEGVVISDAAILWVTRGPLATTGALVLGTVDTEMACGMTLKTTSRCIHDGLWAQAGIVRCNSCGIGGRATLRSDSSYASCSTAVRVRYMGRKTRPRVTLFGGRESMWWWNPWLCKRSMVSSMAVAMWRVEEITWLV